ncbi:adhesion G-protein coupled receptor G2-like isoform X1 [Coregonus clupeaformis]|uniref:adhesion G-protein coupled receptor G2-like isoform X1 n=1 Tax=Coregonus clupeaformis TaxID=59861 RepID=UPI001E1C6FF2|nr:adhesion G-protein coupled receptor G2-like isoform X1 [Coregonus clupeaformis]XP_045065994.1 adhesion G-protein coupled receptor G2-like isoform X1 [Coregonus clupeaformis]XP_045065995.1 adhesion G-protein coupled receptor G2-like isoform X1 [Coregonus clupeaformis]
MEPKSWATLAFLAILLWRPICPREEQNKEKKKHHQQQTRDIQSFLTANKTILVVEGGFTGTMKPCCGNGSKTTTTVNQTMSFNTTSTTLQHECKDWGFWMRKVNNSNLLYTSKTYVNNGMGLFLCVMVGRNCSKTLDYVRKNITACRGTCPLIENKTTNCSVSCFNTTTLCNGTAYKQESCKDLFSGAINQDKFIIDATAPKTLCFNCNEPFQDPVEQLYPTATFTTEKGVDIDGEKASKAMNDISSLVKDMNESSASVFMGSVTGVIVKPKEKDIEEVSFGYSSSSSIKIVEDRGKLGAFSRSVSVTKEAFEKAFKLTNGSAFAGVFRFPNMSKDANNSTVLHNEVVAIEMGTIIANLTDHINLNFRNVQKGGAIPSCQSWDGKGSRPNWTDDGCLTFVKGDNITCECTHLTFFAVLMSPPNQTISDSDLNSLTYITYVGCGMSMFFLGVVLFMHFLLRKSKSNKTTRILIQLFLSMFMLNVTFLSNEWVASLNSPVACQMMAAAMHYSMLSTFTWFAVEAFHLGQQLFKSGAITIPRYIMKVCIAGWVLPSVVVIILFSLGKYGKQSTYTDGGKVMYTCWILDIDVHYIVNIGYYALVFLFTFTTFIVVLRWLFYLKSTKIKTKLGMDQAQQQGTGTKDIVTVMGLCCLLGITWSFAFFAHGVLKVPSYYIFTILNSFQGFFMFLYYYNTSRVIGETTKDDRTSSKCSTLSNTVHTTQENPYVDLGQRHPGEPIR